MMLVNYNQNINPSVMLSFTQNSQAHRNNNLLDFQPLVISNRQPKDLLNRPPQKKITKTISQPNSRQSRQTNTQINFRQKESREKEPERDNWVDGGKIGVFDRKMRKNDLAAQERRIKAQLKKEQLSVVTEFTHKQKGIRTKAVQLQKEQQRQIEQLKQLIDKERQEKERNDQAYHRKLNEIERERAELIKLQRKIQQKGVRNKKEFKQELKVLHKEQYPTNDRAKCHQEIRTHQQQGKLFQISESEANYQRQALRQKQIQLLQQQRERCLQNQPTIGYNPTIIPLLSRASYKIISTHISTLVELFIDDLLEQQVYMLQQIELQQQLSKEKQKEKDIINDYYEKLADFADQVERIQDNVGKYHTMKFQDLYLPKKYSIQPKKVNKSQQIVNICTLKGLETETVEQIQSRRERFVRFVGNFDQYKKSNINMFHQVTEQLIDQAIFKLAQQLDRGSNDFVELVFRKQFQ